MKSIFADPIVNLIPNTILSNKGSDLYRVLKECLNELEIYWNAF